MSDSLRRALRTLFQIGFVNAVITLLSVFGVIDWNPAQTGAVNAVAVPLVTFAQNWLEDNTRFPAVLKATASGGVNPVTTDPTGGTTPATTART